MNLATSPRSLSIVVVNWNTSAMLSACVHSLEAAGGPAEIIVVDNASSDGSARMVHEHFPHAHLVENSQNLGFSRASNQGIDLASGRYVCLLNSDTQVCPGALETLVAFMDAHPLAGCCGPRLRNSDGSLQPSAHPMLSPEREFWRLMFLDWLRPRATYPVHQWDVAHPRRVDVIKGACMMLRREALDEVGPLNESYFMYTEEVDLCHRLTQAGWEIWWEPRSEVIHHGEASSRQAREEMYIQLYRSKAQFFRNFSGEQGALRFKRYLRLAYAPRWAATAVGSLVSGSMRSRRRLYGRFLREIGSF
jgi:N-acetylglucosaminyl-diphospho-decaprenol L-rhamnosyltransferase